jgi:S1-C subfamily serine protease
MGLLQSLSDAVAELAERVSLSVVNIGNGHSWGTGIVWSKEGHIVTANHVVGRADSVRVTLNDSTELEAKVVGRDPDNDLALLKAESGKFVPVEMASGKAPRAGEMVFAFANPMGQRTSVTSGIITSPSRSIRGWWGIMLENAVISDAQLNPGYSGGPLVDASGKLVGMNVAYFSSRGVAISAVTMKDRLHRLSVDGKIRKAYLGIIAEPVELPEELAARSDVGQDGALLVRSVEAGTPAKVAGLSIGDILLKLGGEPVADLFELHNRLTDRVIGTALSMSVLRGEKLTELKVTPSEAEE